MERLESVALGLGPISTLDNDVVICSAVRTPLIKSKRGAFKETSPELLLSFVLKQACARAKVDPKLINDVVIGNVLQPGAGSLTARMGQYLAGFPDSATTVAVNRMCSSGLEACATVAAKIKAGMIEIGIGGGVESMSLYDMTSAMTPSQVADQVYENPKAINCMLSMGLTSENVAQKYGISRQQQDQLAVDSHRKAALAQEKGLFKEEIVPVTVTLGGKKVTVSEDDGIRKQTTLESLGKLKAAFKKEGSTTAGNSSQVTDGAAAVVLARRSTAKRLGLPILAKFVDYVVSGVPPQVMGIGPAFAIPDLLKRNKLTKDDIDIYEINEAFASQATYCVKQIGIDASKLNPKGGAIAFGHPLGCTGARQIATLLPELKRTDKKRGVVSMCIGTGMGAAALIQRE